MNRASFTVREVVTMVTDVKGILLLSNRQRLRGSVDFSYKAVDLFETVFNKKMSLG